MIALVVAAAENGVIGRDGKLPWRLSTDLERFRSLTMGKPLIMGRKTFQSLRKPLEGRDNIVVTHSRDFTADGALIAHDLDAALDLARDCATTRHVDEIAVIGGAEIFRQVLPIADRIYLTLVHASPEGDVVLDWPCLGPAGFAGSDGGIDGWTRAQSEDWPAGPRDEFAATFTVFTKTPTTCSKDPRLTDRPDQ